MVRGRITTMVSSGSTRCSISLCIISLSVSSLAVVGARDGNEKVVKDVGTAGQHIVRADGHLQRAKAQEHHGQEPAPPAPGANKNGVNGHTRTALGLTRRIGSIFTAGLVGLEHAIDDFTEHGVDDDGDAEKDEAVADGSQDVDGKKPQPLHIRKGLDQICHGIWQMFKELTPPQYHSSQEMEILKSQLKGRYIHMPNLTENVNMFRKEGDTTALMRVFLAIFAETVEADPHPVLSTWVSSLGDLLLGLGRAWQFQGQGRPDLALQAVWQGWETASVPMSSTGDDVEKIDAAIGALSTKALSYRRDALSSKVCYKKAHIRHKKRPNQCKDGWKFESPMYCRAAPKPSISCEEPCKEHGMCSGYCGEGMACCKTDSKDAACNGAEGFDAKFEHSQCVKPGPSVVFLIEDAGELILRGYWVNSSVVNGRPAYTHSAHMSGVKLEMQWSTEENNWQIFKENIDSKIIFYISELNASTFPSHSWQVVSGSHPSPKIQAFPFAEQFAPSEATKVAPELRYPSDKQVADCEAPWTKAQLWCWGECPDGYGQKLEWCEQNCAGTGFPASSDGICGVTRSELLLATHVMHMMGECHEFDADTVIKDLAQANIDAGKLISTLYAFIDNGQRFTRPFCPEGVAEVVASKIDREDGRPEDRLAGEGTATKEKHAIKLVSDLVGISSEGGNHDQEQKQVPASISQQGASQEEPDQDVDGMVDAAAKDLDLELEKGLHEELEKSWLKMFAS